MPADRISYARGFPHGAPLVIIRGGALNRQGIREFLYSQGFRWEKRTHGYKHYMNSDEFVDILVILRDDFHCDVQPKPGMNSGYILDLPEPVEGDDDDE